MKLIPMAECIVRRVYRLRCRNLSLGVYVGNGRFVGIREKLGSRFLDTEIHWDKNGTIQDTEDIGVDVPEDIPLIVFVGSFDEATNRPVKFDRPVAEGGKGWYFTDTGEASRDIRARAKENEPLFEFLDSMEDKEEDDDGT
jgi:hypothetical protein